MHHDYFGNKIHGTEESDKITQQEACRPIKLALVLAVL